MKSKPKNGRIKVMEEKGFVGYGFRGNGCQGEGSTGGETRHGRWGWVVFTEKELTQSVVNLIHRCSFFSSFALFIWLMILLGS